jgi:hypothetical protein
MRHFTLGITTIGLLTLILLAGADLSPQGDNKRRNGR